MKEDNTPTVTARRRTPSRKLRIRLETAKMIQNWNKKALTVRQRKRVAKRRAKQADTGKQVLSQRCPKIKKNTLVKPPTATSKFKRRQVRKAWLPTHLWHAKRAKMTKPTEPLWRMAIPLSPAEKVYRISHRSSGARGCVAWDMSYMSTICCQGTGAGLENLLKSLSFQGEGWVGKRYEKWRGGYRVAHGWLCERDGEKRMITPATVFWNLEVDTVEAGSMLKERLSDSKNGNNDETNLSSTSNRKKKPKLKSKLMIRVHPSGFHQLWLELLKVAKMQRPQVVVEDLRSEIGGIEIIGPDSTQALVEVLKPSKGRLDHGSVEETWKNLAALSNPAALPQNCLFGFNISDPRLHMTPKRVHIPFDSNTSELTDFLISWPPDQSRAPLDLFSHTRRYSAVRGLQSQKAINRYKAGVSKVRGETAEKSQSQIPVMLFSTKGPSPNSQGTWTVMLPWKCVDPVWRCLLYCPLSTSNTPQFGGLNEKRQILFENGQPWFPGDMPGTEAGKAWARTQDELRFDTWVSRPAKHRVSWHTIDLGLGQKGEHGNGWMCDWEFLFRDKKSGILQRPEKRTIGHSNSTVTETRGLEPNPSKPLTQRQRKAMKQQEQKAAQQGQGSRPRNTSSPESEDKEGLYASDELLRGEVGYCHLTPPAALAALSIPTSRISFSQPTLITIHVTCLTRGTAHPCARIYRLPTGDDVQAVDLRKRWLSFLPGSIRATQDLRPHLKKHPKLNHHGLPRSQRALPRESVDHITYIPPDAPPEIVEQYRPNPQLDTTESRAGDESKLEKGAVVVNTGHDHPPCPRVDDLIGFVTTGGFNLALGRGTAIGSIWLQRLLEGWKEDGNEEYEEEQQQSVLEHGSTGENPKARDGKATEKATRRHRHICIVRNAGEKVGRLAIWELCT